MIRWICESMASSSLYNALSALGVAVGVARGETLIQQARIANLIGDSREYLYTYVYTYYEYSTVLLRYKVKSKKYIVLRYLSTVRACGGSHCADGSTICVTRRTHQCKQRPCLSFLTRSRASQGPTNTADPGSLGALSPLRGEKARAVMNTAHEIPRLPRCAVTIHTHTHAVSRNATRLKMGAGASTTATTLPNVLTPLSDETRKVLDGLPKNVQDELIAKWVPLWLRGRQNLHFVYETPGAPVSAR